MKEIGRRQRFRRRLRGEGKAVSPVVATLILILIAVAAAAALYLWLVAWQGGVTKGIGSPGAQYTVTIGGSTSVYPFDQVAVSYFEGNNSDVVIANNQGGTGAGMIAVCNGQVDIGASSTAQTVAGLQSNDGCPASTQIQIVAYDAVDVITPVANVHGLVSINFDTLALVYADATVLSHGTPTLVPTTENGQTIPTGIPTPATVTTANPLVWDQIPAVVLGATVGTTTQALSAGVGGVITTDYTPCGSGDLCAVSATHDTPCGFTVCAGGTAAGSAAGDYAATIVTVARSDASGTTQTFEARLLDATSGTAFATTFSGIGFGGCGSNNLIADCGYTSTLTGNGNPGVISTVAGNPDAIGYASDGLARLSSSGVTCQGIASNGCGVGLESVGQSAAVQPSLGSSGSIAIGTILGGFGPAGQTTTKTIASAYGGARPFEYVTTSAPTGEVQRYINFVMQPGNNIAIASASDEVSYYSV
ncbi:MAG TPA: substrate-binding domain-containing protein [Thermoplasmata archaeon]|nr:substrate-binding domain-containing protein [Thermoplasmata archaeon]